VGGDDDDVGFGSVTGKTTMMMKVDERVRFLLRTAIRAEGQGDLRIAHLFRRMAEDMRTGEGALVLDGPVLGVVAK
jgi:hypothetical protein